MTKVIMTIDLDGNATLEVNGATGPQCKELTANIERLLGSVRSVEHKSEFHELNGQSTQTDLGQF